uniref:RanBP2-type domain-containing protein n=1 Tax=Ananas comosus var. bracteatus TaxID=296719 RepID=A0A6V7PPW8_ANACO|nr:unnamed protein product [Ananas comosus var. bracteatus]
MYRRVTAAVTLIPPHALLRRRRRLLSHSPLPSPRLRFVRRELEHLRSPPFEPDQTLEGRRERVVGGGCGGGGGRRRLMELLLKKGHLDRAALFPVSPDGAKDSNHIRTACLSFARDRADLIRYLSRKDIHIVVRCGCPSIDRKVVNSGKRLRAHVGIDEGDVCSRCSLRGNCERAYVKAQKKEVGRTIDVMRILLTYGLDSITGSVINQSCVNKTVKDSIKKLLKEMVELGFKEFGSGTEKTMVSGQSAIPMKQGDWICPKCNFMNFAKNIKCLHCNGEFQVRYKMLHEDQEHLPLKKGDWICKKCNFFNFAKNTKCLQCHEKPTNRLLNLGEWECPSCNYVNFRRNALCLRCNWKRPKALNNQEISGTHRDGQARSKHSPFSFVRESTGSDRQHISPKKSQSLESDSDSWSSMDDDDEDDGNDIDSWKRAMDIDNFPIIGGNSAVSHDPKARLKWKEDVYKRSKGLSERESKVINGVLSCGSRPSSLDLDQTSDDDDDDIASWFASGQENKKLEKLS